MTPTDSALPAETDQPRPVAQDAKAEEKELTAQDLEALKVWAKLGMLLDQMIDVKWTDDVTVTSAKCSSKAGQGGVLWIFSGLRKRQPVVAFHRDELACNGLHVFAARRRAHQVSWRVDEPPSQTLAGAPVEPDSLPPKPEL